MKKTLAATAVLLTVCSSSFAALPPGVFTSQRVHVSNSQPVHTPTHNRVRMTPSHGQMGPIGGRMSSMPPGGPSSAHVRVSSPPARVYVRPPLPLHRYYRPLPAPPPPRWYSYGYGSVWWGYPVAYYNYPYGVYYGRYYAGPGIRIGISI